MRGTKIRWHEKSYATFRHRIRQLTGRSWGVSMEYRYHKLAQYIRGWMGYYGISEYYRPIPGIDQWIRRRMRMCYWTDSVLGNCSCVALLQYIHVLILHYLHFRHPWRSSSGAMRGPR